MRKGICCAGNMLVDITYPIEGWPAQGELVRVLPGIGRSTGGAVCNVIADLARLDPTLPLAAAGIAGHDPEGDFILRELARYSNVDTSAVLRTGQTAFTLVMSNTLDRQRTFFQYAGAMAEYGEEHLALDTLDCAILHVGYLLLLPHLDAPDAVYGTRMARLLHRAQSLGIKTSVDVVTAADGAFAAVVPPALKYTDYCTVNELEAQRITGVELRAVDGTLLRQNMPAALRRLRQMGVAVWAVIHCPEAGFGMDEAGVFYECPSLSLPQGYIKGTVGAGDAFCAGVLYAAHSGMPLAKALQLGAATAAASLAHPSASEGVGSLADVLALGEAYAAKAE